MSIKRNTNQRKIILDAVKKMHIHQTVEEVYEEIKKTHPNISKATVYRNLHQLSENGDIRQVSMPDDVERYDRRTDRHYHFQCKICGTIYDIDIDYLERIDETVQQKYNFQIDDHDILFKGICQNCKINNNKKIKRLWKTEIK